MPPEIHHPDDLPAWARELLRTAPVGRLATVDDAGRPHLVPICFALDELHIYSAVDRKPKRHQRLRRLENLRHRPLACVLVDVYCDDWRRLAWVRIDASTTILEQGEDYDRALALLTSKYPQYRRMELVRAAGPVIRLTPRHLSCWRAETEVAG